MGDSKKESGESLPQNPPAANISGDDSKAHDADTTAEQAKKFLQDPEVQKETRTRKVEFLKSKGIDVAVIDKLLADQDEEVSWTCAA
jgi:hypothetical protein